MVRDTKAVTVRHNIALGNLIKETGLENIRNIVGQDRTRADSGLFELLQTKLQLAFAAPETAYSTLTALDVIHRNR
jgi:hypothetical protein